MQRLKQAAEAAKIELSSSIEAQIDLPFIHFDGMKSLHLEEIITRQEFDNLLGPFIEGTIVICERAKKDFVSDYRPSIDAIVLVGGSTRIPLVRKRLEEFFGKAPIGSLRREDVVALGAAIHAGVLQNVVEDVVLLEVTPLSLGIETLGGVFTCIIDRNTDIPTKKSQVFSTAEVFSTAKDKQNTVTISVFEGEREMAADNKLLGQFDLVGIPPAPGGVPQIEVSFDIDANGIVYVSAKDKATGKEQEIRLQVSGGLSRTEIERMSRDAQLLSVASISLTRPAKLDATPPAKVREEAIELPASSVGSAVVDNSSANPTKPRVFLSYAREDSAFVGGIEKVLSLSVRSGKIDLWVDRRINPGEEWEREIFSAIVKRCNLVVIK